LKSFGPDGPEDVLPVFVHRVGAAGHYPAERGADLVVTVIKAVAEVDRVGLPPALTEPAKSPWPVWRAAIVISFIACDKQRSLPTLTCVK